MELHKADIELPKTDVDYLLEQTGVVMELAKTNVELYNSDYGTTRNRYGLPARTDSADGADQNKYGAAQKQTWNYHTQIWTMC